MRGLPVILLLLLAACSQPSETTQELVDRSADLRVFEEGFLAVDNSFSDSARAEAQERLEELKQASGKMNDAQFELAIAEIAALTENGHSTLYAAHWAEKFNRLAVRFYIADDGLFVADAQPGFEELIGKKVERVAGQNLADLRVIWDRYHNGTVGYRDQTLYYFIESPEILHAAGLAKSADEVTLEFAGGGKATIPVTTDWPAPEGIWAILPLAREIELSKAGRVTDAPLYLQEPDAFYRTAGLANGDVPFIQFRANVDFSRQIDMHEVTQSTIDELRQQKPRYVIVDQRFNIGGDLNNTRDLMQALPEIVGSDGQIFVITSGRTFSAGIASVGYLKQASGAQLTIIGKPVGDLLEFWAEGQPVQLPQSGAYIGVATERHNYMTGCPEDDCHGSIRLHPIAIDNLEPDLQPAFTYDDPVAGRDPYLTAALTLIEEREKAD